MSALVASATVRLVVVARLVVSSVGPVGDRIELTTANQIHQLESHVQVVSDDTQAEKVIGVGVAFDDGRDVRIILVIGVLVDALLDGIELVVFEVLDDHHALDDQAELHHDGRQPVQEMPDQNVDPVGIAVEAESLDDHGVRIDLRIGFLEAGNSCLDDLVVIIGIDKVLDVHGVS